MNRLSLDRRTQIVSALVEGNSIRSTERMIERLGITACQGRSSHKRQVKQDQYKSAGLDKKGRS